MGRWRQDQQNFLELPLSTPKAGEQGLRGSSSGPLGCSLMCPGYYVDQNPNPHQSGLDPRGEEGVGLRAPHDTVQPGFLTHLLAAGKNTKNNKVTSPQGAHDAAD